MMITLVCCSCYFDLMLYMKNKLPQVFRDAVSGCLKSVGKITDMREKEKKCIDFIEIQNDSVIIVCLNCLQYQIQLTDRKRFINILLEGECFNFKKKSHVLCVNALCGRIISANEMCWGCISQCCKVFLFYDFYRFFLE